MTFLRINPSRETTGCAVAVNGDSTVATTVGPSVTWASSTGTTVSAGEAATNRSGTSQCWGTCSGETESMQLIIRVASFTSAGMAAKVASTLYVFELSNPFISSLLPSGRRMTGAEFSPRQPPGSACMSAVTPSSEYVTNVFSLLRIALSTLRVKPFWVILTGSANSRSCPLRTSPKPGTYPNQCCVTATTTVAVIKNITNTSRIPKTFIRGCMVTLFPF